MLFGFLSRRLVHGDGFSLVGRSGNAVEKSAADSMPRWRARNESNSAPSASLGAAIIAAIPRGRILA
jgi:hypothetical protein